MSRIREASGSGIGGRFAGRSGLTSSQPGLGVGKGTNKTGARDGSTRHERESAKETRDKERLADFASRKFMDKMF